ncbi:Trm112 family protein [Monashia sp. NPDC004114]
MSQSQKTVEPWLRAILRCPKCKGELTDAVHTSGATSIAELRCPTCLLAYPIESGVPVLLTDLARHFEA